jgi:hypothetical protein
MKRFIVASWCKLLALTFSSSKALFGIAAAGFLIGTRSTHKSCLLAEVFGLVTLAGDAEMKVDGGLKVMNSCLKIEGWNESLRIWEDRMEMAQI